MWLHWDARRDGDESDRDSENIEPGLTTSVLLRPRVRSTLFGQPVAAVLVYSPVHVSHTS